MSAITVDARTVLSAVSAAQRLMERANEDLAWAAQRAFTYPTPDTTQWRDEKALEARSATLEWDSLWQLFKHLQAAS